MFRNNYLGIQMKALVLLGYIAALFLDALTNGALADSPRARDRFPIYYQMTRINAGYPVPSLDKIGLKPIRIAYHGRFGIDASRAPAELAAFRLRLENLKKAASAIRNEEELAPSNFTILDIEIWPVDTNVSDDVAKASVEKYANVVKTLRALLPGREFGYYGLPVGRDYRASISDPLSSEYGRWQARNDLMAPLADQTDIFMPSLYSFNFEAHDEWETYARAHIRESRRLATRGQKVIPFIWPYYHDRSRWKGRPISAVMWRRQLDLLAELADGVFIWSNDSNPIDEKTPWVNATREFLTELDSKED